MKYKVVELIDSGEKGVLLIEEKQYAWGYSLNLIIIEDGRLVAISSDDFKVIGEIEIDD